MWSARVITLFPDLFPGPLKASVLGRGLDRGIWSISAINLRNYGLDNHKTVDDTPYGGGSGMVIRPDVLGLAIEDNFFNNGNEIIYLSPRGEPFNQPMARSLAQCQGVNLICGRFEGIDERVINEYRIREVSLGDFILSSGDVAAFPFLDACVRLLPGILGNQESIQQESFGVGCGFLLEHPHFTKPRMWKDRSVPDELLSGNHKVISDWRLMQSEYVTRISRPDLWEKYLISRKKNELIGKI